MTTRRLVSPDTLPFGDGAGTSPKGATRPPWTLTLLAALLIAIVLLPSGGQAFARDTVGPPPGATALYPSPADRLGFGVTHPPVTNYDVAPLQAGWYYDWSPGANPQHPAGLAFAHLIRVPLRDPAATQAAVAQAAQNDPGALWLIGNEPDVFTMDNVFPEVYAESYHRAYLLIKAHDPTAVVAAGGIVMPTELRLQYLDMILDAYRQKYGQPLPADAWHIHNYVLNEQRGVAPGIPPGICVPYGVMPGVNKHDNLALFQGQIVAMRQWMAGRGYRDRPLIISEYGILYPQQRGFDYYRVKIFLYATFDYLLSAADPAIGYPADDNHLVQAWNWFSLDETHFAGGGLTWGALFDPQTRQRTPMGDAWASYVTEKGLYVPYSDLRPVAIRLEALAGRETCHVPAQSPQGGTCEVPGSSSAGPEETTAFYGEDTPVCVSVLVTNRGNAAVAGPFQVAIYAGQAGQGETLLTGRTLPGLPARYEGPPTWVTATWTLPATAGWTIRAQVSDTNRTLVLSRRIDLNLDSLTVQPSTHPRVRAGETTALTLTATVDNYGNVGLRDVQVEFWEGGPPGVGRRLAATVIPELPPLASAQAQFVWPAVPQGAYDFYAVISPPPDVPEDDLTNNQARQEVLVTVYQLHLPLVRSGPCCLTCQESELVHNGSFETGNFSAWQVVGYPIVQQDAPHSVDGSHYAWLGMRDRGHDEVYQTVVVPPRVVTAVLLYAWGVYTQDICDAQSPKDRLTVSIRDIQGQTLQVLDSYSECDASVFWEGTGFDLRAYAGQTIQIHFQADTDSQRPSYFCIDDIHLHVCSNE